MASSSADVDLTRLAERLRQVEPSSTDAELIVNEIKALLHSRHPFRDLRTSPFLPNGGPRFFDSQVVILATRNLRALGTLLVLPENRRALFLDSIETCLRGIWSALVPWLDYFHPMHHVGTERLQRAPLVSVADIFAALFRMKEVIHDLLAQTPRLYGLLFVFWLNIDRYFTKQNMFDLMAQRADRLGHAILNHAVWTAGVHQPSLSAADADPIAIDGARWAVKDSSRRFYRRATDHAAILLQATAEGDHDHLVLLQNHLNAIQLFADQLWPIPCMPRAVVRTLVRMLSVVRPLLPPAHAVVGSICSALHAIWRTAEDTRALVWALRAGVVQLMLEAMDGASAPITKAQVALQYIATRTAHLEVVRALPKMPFVGAAPSDKDAFSTDVEAMVHARIRLAKTAYQKKCAYDMCTTSAEDARSRIRRCSCLDVCYCSTQCQQSDWTSHRRTHKVDGPFKKRDGILTPLGAHFLALLGREHVHSEHAAILANIRQTLRDCPDASPSMLVHVEICMSALHPLRKLSIQPLTAMRLDRILSVEHWVIVSASIRKDSGEYEAGLPVQYTPLRELQGESVWETIM